MPDLEIPRTLIALWSLWLLQAIWCVYNVWAFRRRFHRLERQHRRRAGRDGGCFPPTVLIVPVKGVGKNLERSVEALLGQDHPDYRVQFVVESDRDPAFPLLANCGGDVLVAGCTERGGQKLHNLMAALDALRPGDEVVAFADADGLPPPHWLRRLVEPLRNRRTGATTAYRWFVPDGGMASAAMTVMNASVATLQGSDWRTLAWGGAMALRREVIEEVRLREFWHGALSDDYRLSAAVRRAGRKLSLVPACMVPSPVGATWASLWEFGRRQYRITRLYLPWAWWVALAATGLYAVSFASAVGALALGGTSTLVASLLLVTVFALDATRGALRIGIQGLVLAADDRTGRATTRWMELLLTPVWMSLHGLIIASSLFGRKLRWAGITYDVRKPHDVRIVARS